MTYSHSESRPGTNGLVETCVEAFTLHLNRDKRWDLLFPLSWFRSLFLTWHWFHSVLRFIYIRANVRTRIHFDLAATQYKHILRKTVHPFQVTSLSRSQRTFRTDNCWIFTDSKFSFAFNPTVFQENNSSG